MNETAQRLLAAAEAEEKDQGRVSKYADFLESFRVLRKKHWSWPRIAEWMTEHTGEEYNPHALGNWYNRQEI